MKKLCAILIIFGFTFSCIPDTGNEIIDPNITATDNGNQNSGEGDQDGTGNQNVFHIEDAPEGYENIGVTIKLPIDSAIKSDELVLQSLFTEKEPVSDGYGVAQTFAGNAFELIYATDATGQIQLLSFLNPSKSKRIVLNSESTSIAMVMLHPWTMHLSVETKEEAVEKIKNLPEFKAFKEQVDTMIGKGSLNFEVTNAIFTSLLSVQSKMKEMYLTSKGKSALTMSYGEKKVTIQNKNSSMVYGLRLYNEDDEAVGKPIYTYNVNKTILSFSNMVNIATGNFDIFQPSSSIDFPITENGKYTLKAKSGFSFDDTDENEGAALRNCLEVGSNIIGIFSSTLGLILKKASCAISIGSWFYGKLKTSLQLYLQNKKTAKELLKDAIAIIGDNSAGLYSIAKDCAKVPKNNFTKIFKAMGILSNLENGLVTSLNIFDWAYYDHEEEYCIILDSQVHDFVGCIDINILEESLDFGEQFVNTISFKNITIENKGNDLTFYLALGIPGFNSSNPNNGVLSNYYGFNWLIEENGVGELITIKKDETKTLKVKFEPLEIKEYSSHSFWLIEYIRENPHLTIRNERDRVFLNGKGIEQP